MMPILQPLESMERISRQALADDLDAVLERICLLYTSRCV